MANVVLTRTCNRACSFCFAPNDASAPMTLGELADLVERLKASGQRVVPIVGGEPTLHPEFERVIELIVAQGMRLLVFTNGDLSGAVRRRLVELPETTCSLVVNVSASLTTAGRVAVHVERNLAELGARATLGVTLLDEPWPDLALAELYDRHSLGRSFRLGLAQPTLEGSNRSADYRRLGLGAYVTELALALVDRHVRVDFDCGFVLCTFSAEQRLRLQNAGVAVRSTCGTIPDLAPGNVAWPCYPLSGRYREDGGRGPGGLLALRPKFEARLEPFRAAGLYPECPTCEFFRSGRCTGGCLARVIAGFSPLGAES